MSVGAWSRMRVAATAPRICDGIAAGALLDLEPFVQRTSSIEHQRGLAALHARRPARIDAH